MFFNSWELWEQMTFVLAAAIVVVVVIGYCKLLWINRLVHRQELVDEEKRTRVQSLRNNGQIVEARKSDDIPFGVRAIQSGIQVDGIWVSQGQTPIPTELKLGRLKSSSSNKAPSADSSKNASTSTNTTVGAVRSESGTGRSHSRSIDLGERVEVPGGHRSPPVSMNDRPSYKPRRSSHLRYGSHGQYDEATLNRLERKASLRKKVEAQRPRGLRTPAVEHDSSSAADNERSSGASFESDATLSHKPRSRIDPSQQYLLGDTAYQQATVTSSNIGTRRPIRKAHTSQSHDKEYFSIPTGSPRRYSGDPFISPLASPIESPENQDYEEMQSFAGPKQLDRTRHDSADTRPALPFVAGELHINKSIRKVNSGFEVLPAGTFGVPAEFTKAPGNVDDDASIDKRQSSRLQKKPRSSMSERRPSSTSERA